MQTGRRSLLRQLAALGLCTGLAPALATRTHSQTRNSRLILLGTQGGPNFQLQRAECASLLVVDNSPYLIDCGYGTLRGLLQSGINYLDIGGIFLSHLHDDHVSDLVALLSHQWTQGRIDPTTVFGPYGTGALVQAALDFQQANVRIRMHDEARSVDPAALQRSTELRADDEIREVHSDGRVSVRAVANTHYPAATLEALPDRSLAYRFDCPDRSIVFSGDTSYSSNLVRLARDADLLVCEVMDRTSIRAAFDALVAAGNYADNPEGIWQHIVATHSTTEQAGRMAAEAGVRTLVFTHVLPGALNPALAEERYIAGARQAFSGEIIVGRDLLEL